MISSGNSELESKLIELKKKAEQMIHDVSGSSKCLDDELKLFRKSKQEEVNKIMKDFVAIMKKSSEEMKNQWSSFVNNVDVQNANRLESSFHIGAKQS